MNKLGIITLILIIISQISCVFYPKYSHVEDDIEAGFITRKLELNVVSSDIDKNDFDALTQLIDVISDSNDAPEAALIAGLLVLSIPVGSAIISGSIVVGNNTIYWLEGQVREDDSKSRKALKKYYKSIKRSGLVFIRSTDDLLKWLKLKEREE